MSYDIEFPYYYLRVGEHKLHLDIALSDLVDALGAPASREPSGEGEIARWQGIDVRSDAAGDVVAMTFRLRPQVSDPEGTTYYDGTLVADGKDLINDPQEEWVGNDGVGGPAVLDDDRYVIAATISLKTERPKNDYVIKPVRGKTLEFTDLNFKLLVIDELMYNQEILDPPFYLSEYAEHAGLDLEEHLGETIEGALRYFEELPIPAKLAKEVDVLEQDGGLQIYAETVYQWAGEDDRFDVRSVRDAAQFKSCLLYTSDAADE